MGEEAREAEGAVGDWQSAKSCVGETANVANWANVIDRGGGLWKAGSEVGKRRTAMEKNQPVTIVVGIMTAVAIVAGCFIGASVMPGQPLMAMLPILAVILVGLALIVSVNFLVFVPLVWIIAKLGGSRLTVVSDDSPCASNRSPLRHRAASLAVFVLDVAGLLLITFCTTSGVPRFRLIFDDLLEGRRLPLLTNAFMSVPGAAYVLLFSGLIIALIIKELYVANKTRTLIVNVAVFVAVALFFMVFVVAMFMPMVVTIGTIDG